MKNSTVNPPVVPKNDDDLVEQPPIYEKFPPQFLGGSKPPAYEDLDLTELPAYEEFPPKILGGSQSSAYEKPVASSPSYSSATNSDNIYEVPYAAKKLGGAEYANPNEIGDGPYDVPVFVGDEGRVSPTPPPVPESLLRPNSPEYKKEPPVYESVKDILGSIYETPVTLNPNYQSPSKLTKQASDYEVPVALNPDYQSVLSNISDKPPAYEDVKNGSDHIYAEPVTLNLNYQSPSELTNQDHIYENDEGIDHIYAEPVTLNPNYQSPSELKNQASGPSQKSTNQVFEPKEPKGIIGSILEFFRSVLFGEKNDPKKKSIETKEVDSENRVFEKEPTRGTNKDVSQVDLAPATAAVDKENTVSGAKPNFNAGPNQEADALSSQSKAKEIEKSERKGSWVDRVGGSRKDYKESFEAGSKNQGTVKIR